jgi:uncharacterized protein YceK
VYGSNLKIRLQKNKVSFTYNPFNFIILLHLVGCSTVILNSHAGDRDEATSIRITTVMFQKRWKEWCGE